jgi:hypothetical protein
MVARIPEFILHDFLLLYYGIRVLFAQDYRQHKPETGTYVPAKSTYETMGMDGSAFLHEGHVTV